MVEKIEKLALQYGSKQFLINYFFVLFIYNTPNFSNCSFFFKYEHTTKILLKVKTDCD